LVTAYRAVVAAVLINPIDCITKFAFVTTYEEIDPPLHNRGDAVAEPFICNKLQNEALGINRVVIMEKLVSVGKLFIFNRKLFVPDPAIK
jgi:hypothetical protein